MTDNEIVKALECCTSKMQCFDCPRFDGIWGMRAFTHCDSKMKSDALDLINRQKAEIERLKGEVAKEFICFVGNPHKVEQCPYLEELSKVKAEAIKETVEKVADEVRRVNVSIPFPADGITTKEEMQEWGNIVAKLLSTAVNNALKKIKEMEGEG